MKYLIPVLIAASTLLAAVAGATTPVVESGVAVAAVFPPWWSRERSAAAVAAADGLIVREGVVGSILVVRADGPLLADRLRGNGAILLLDPGAPGGCLSAS